MTIRIGNLEIFRDRRQVCVEGEIVPIGTRAWDVLLLLIEADGALVSKSELMAKVWPETIVEENNLHVHISTLRKLLGKHRNLLLSIPGRGYRLLTTRESTEVAPPVQVHGNQLAPATNLPSYSPRLFGRETSVEEILGMLTARNIVTLIGAGGIGKTTLGLEVGRRSVEDYSGGVWLVELTKQSDAESVPAAIASAMGFTMSSDARAAQAVINLIGGKQTLLILDNCEHLVSAVAEFVCLLALASPNCKVLATSRESLRIQDEFLFHVEPLDVPSTEESGTSVLQHSAVQLFLARARAMDARFPSDVRSLALTGFVCKRLDGIPLAIELAAARAAYLGVEVLAKDIDDRIQTLGGGHRNALPRHQTLKATFDWSYKLLPSIEQKVLNRLSVLRGHFTLEDASAVASRDDLLAHQITDAIWALTTKSLIVADIARRPGIYRLLETTRGYAFQKLKDSGEQDATELRRVIHLCAEFRHIRDNWAITPVDQSLVEIHRRLENTRAALDWAFSKPANTRLARELAVLLVPRLFDLSLVQECSDRARQAISSIPENGDPLAEDGSQLRLLCAHASGMVYTGGPGPQVRQEWTKVLELAVTAGESWFEARAMWGLWNACQYGGRSRDALCHARRFAEVADRAASEPHQILSLRIIAIAEHYCGNHARADELLEKMLDRYVHNIHRRDAIGLGVNHCIVAKATLARLRLVQGQTNEARHLASATLEEAHSYGQAMVTSYVLVEAVVPISLLTGDMEAARPALENLHELSTRFGFEIWRTCSECFSALVAWAYEYDERLYTRFTESIAAMCALNYLAHYTLLHGLTATVLQKAGRNQEALAWLKPALSHCERTGERWYYPELLRIKGDILRQWQNGQDWAVEAESTLIAAMVLARNQGAKLFELRAAFSLANLLQTQGRVQDALLLAPILSAFPAEESEDARVASNLLDKLRLGDEDVP